MAKLGLSPERNRIFRITHIRNVPWILQHGLHCRSSQQTDPDFLSIGSPALIGKRVHRIVPLPPGGTLADYVPFYFTPRSKMLYNIATGWEGIAQRPNADIAILVSSLDRLAACRVPFLFTSGHAYMEESAYFASMADLKHIDWPLLNRGDFKTDPNDPGKSNRYQAEALAHRQVPVEALLGIACYDQAVAAGLQREATRLAVSVEIRALPAYYFSP